MYWRTDVCTGVRTYVLAYGRTDGWTYKQTDVHTACSDKSVQLWIDRETNGQIEGRMKKWRDGLTDGGTDREMEGRMERWRDGWRDGGTDEEMEGRIDRWRDG